MKICVFHDLVVMVYFTIIIFLSLILDVKCVKCFHGEHKLWNMPMDLYGRIWILLNRDCRNVIVWFYIRFCEMGMDGSC